MLHREEHVVPEHVDGNPTDRVRRWAELPIPMGPMGMGKVSETPARLTQTFSTRMASEAGSISWGQAMKTVSGRSPGVELFCCQDLIIDPLPGTLTSKFSSPTRKTKIRQIATRAGGYTDGQACTDVSSQLLRQHLREQVFAGTICSCASRRASMRPS